MKLRKGDLARVVSPDKRWPHDLINEAYGIYMYTPEEISAQSAEWYDSWNSAGSSGDPSAIPPDKEYVSLPAGEIVQVIRARARLPQSRGTSRMRGWALILSTRTGRQIYIQRKHIQPVGDTTSEKERET